MSDRLSTFGGTWTRPQQDGSGRSLRELQDRASYDQASAAGASCLLAVVASLGLSAAAIAAFLHTTGVIA